MGIQDQLAVLKWVQANIGDFGGDKSRVIKFGQSSGAGDTFVISTLPEAKDLISSHSPKRRRALHDSYLLSVQIPYHLRRLYHLPFSLGTRDRPLSCQKLPPISLQYHRSTSDAVVATISHIATTSSFIYPSYCILRSAAVAGTDAYGYHFNHTPSCLWFEIPGFSSIPTPELKNVFGATHTSETSFPSTILIIYRMVTIPAIRRFRSMS